MIETEQGHACVLGHLRAQVVSLRNDTLYAFLRAASAGYSQELLVELGCTFDCIHSIKCFLPVLGSDVSDGLLELLLRLAQRLFDRVVMRSLTSCSGTESCMSGSLIRVDSTGALLGLRVAALPHLPTLFGREETIIIVAFV